MKTEQTSEKPDSPTLPPRPEKPDPSDCCGRGCERCIFVYYEEALVRWHKRVKAADPGNSLGNATNTVLPAD